MSIEDFIIAVFCLIDEEMKKVVEKKKLRARGPNPVLSDSEMITMEIVGDSPYALIGSVCNFFNSKNAI